MLMPEVRGESHRKKFIFSHDRRLRRVGVVACGLCCFSISICRVHAAVYYVATDGSNSRTPAEAQNINTPWRTINYAAGRVADGDTVMVRGGIYDEEVVMQSDGVTWQAYPGETPVIDGSVALNTPIPLQDANDFLDPDGTSIAGRFDGSVHWKNIYKTTFPVSDTSLPSYSMYRTMILEDGDLMAVSSLPEQNTNLYDDSSDYKPVHPGCYGKSSFLVTSGFGEPNDFWDGAIIKIYLSTSNTILIRRVADWDCNTQTFTFSYPLSTSLSYGDRYKLENHWGCLTRPGEIYVPPADVNGFYTAYIWPQNDPNATFCIAKHDTGWSLANGNDDNLVIDGFTIRNFCGPESESVFAMGRQFATEFTMDNTIIRNCTIQNITGNYGIVLTNARNCIVDNCTVSNARVGWGIFCRNYSTTYTRGQDVLIENCNVDWCQGTNYKITECDYAQIRNCTIGRSGIHGNGIAIYENCSNIGIFHNQAVNAAIGIAYQGCTNLYVIGNECQTEWLNMAHWEDSTAGDMIFLHNTMALGPAVSDLYYDAGFSLWSVDDPGSPAHYVVKNNIFWSTIYAIPWSYVTPPNTFEKSYNCFLQSTEHWSPGTGSFESSQPENLFTDWSDTAVRDLTIKSMDADIYQAGVNVDDIMAAVEAVFAARGAVYSVDLSVDRYGTAWADTPSIGAYEFFVPPVENQVYNPAKQQYYLSIQQAIADANVFDEIVVYPGTYFERIDFLGKPVTVRNCDPNDRAIVDVTVIDANGLGRVVTFHHGEDANSILSGFTISGGYAADSGVEDKGGGIFCFGSSPVIENCRIQNNYAARYGGGLYACHSSPQITGCTFSENQAGQAGGGLMNDANGILTVTDCIFAGNTAYDKGGGMMNDANSRSVVFDCVFTGNVSENAGGGMYNDANSLPMVLNCTFTGNSAMLYGGGLSNFYSDPNISNCIFWDNTAFADGDEIYNDHSVPTIRCCDIAGSGGSSNWLLDIGMDCGGNIDVDPLFADANGIDNIRGSADDDLRLLAGSPCIDAGDNTEVPSGGLHDLAGRLRFVDDLITADTGYGFSSVVDIGAYEYACKGNLDAWADVTLSDFALFSQQWMNQHCGRCDGADFTGDNKVDMDDLLSLTANWLCGMASETPG